jgi:transcriptional regulator with PAS, ATPase and Fis domain
MEPAAPVATFPSASAVLDESSFPVMTLAKAEELAIRAALRDAKGNRNKAAATLGLHRTTLYKKIDEYKIPVGQD